MSVTIAIARYTNLGAVSALEVTGHEEVSTLFMAADLDGKMHGGRLIVDWPNGQTIPYVALARSWQLKAPREKIETLCALFKNNGIQLTQNIDTSLLDPEEKSFRGNFPFIQPIAPEFLISALTLLGKFDPVTLRQIEAMQKDVADRHAAFAEKVTAREIRTLTELKTRTFYGSSIERQKAKNFMVTKIRATAGIALRYDF